MSKFIGLPTYGGPLVAVGLAAVGFTAVGLTTASANFGEYTTRIPEGRLFINGGRILRCDLFFSAPGIEHVVAPKGSELQQTVPPVVWQYSGLLPVSDYLKTVAIHSVATDEKIRPWQEVQSIFYNGLRAEGVKEVDAKIAFAGAYAFAPRWPLVEFVEITEEEVLYPSTVLYEVQYVQPNTKGMSLEDYRTLALQILQRPDDVSLTDIREAIDATDATDVKARERASLGGIGKFFSDRFKGVTTHNGAVVQTEQRKLAQTMDHKFAHAGGKSAEAATSTDSIMTGVAVEIPEFDIGETKRDEPMNEEIDQKDIILAGAADAVKLDGPEDDWTILPDGSMILRSIERLVSR